MRERLLQGGREAFMNWVRVEDAARAAVLALEGGRPGELYLVTDGEPVRRGDFYAGAARRAGIAIPELDGRIVAPAFAFAEVVDDGDELGSSIKAYRTVPDRTTRVAGIALRHARLRRTTNRDKRIALVLSAYPTKQSRLGNAVGLDTPASATALLTALREAGYDLGDALRGVDGDELMARLADGLTYDSSVLSPAQQQAAVGAGVWPVEAGADRLRKPVALEGHLGYTVCSHRASSRQCVEARRHRFYSTCEGLGGSSLSSVVNFPG